MNERADTSLFSPKYEVAPESLPLKEAQRLIHSINQIRLVAYQDFAVFLKRNTPETFTASFLPKDYGLPPSGLDTPSDFEHLLGSIDSRDNHGGLWFKSHFLLNKFLNSSLRQRGYDTANNFIIKSDDQCTNIAFITIPEVNYIILSYAIDPVPTNRDFHRNTEGIFVIATEPGKTTDIVTYIQKYGQKGLNALFAVLLSPHVTPFAADDSPDIRTNYLPWCPFTSAKQWDVITTVVPLHEIEALKPLPKPTMVKIPGFPSH